MTRFESWLARYCGKRIAHLLTMELRLLQALLLFAQGRRDIPRAGLGFSAHKNVLTNWIILIALGVLELFLFSFLPFPESIRSALFVLGLWGLLVVCGAAAGLVTHPHTLDAETLRLRTGFWQQIAIPRASLSECSLISRTCESGLTVTGESATFASGNQVNVVIRLASPTDVAGQLVTSIATWVDSPGTLLAALTH